MGLSLYQQAVCSFICALLFSVRTVVSFVESSRLHKETAESLSCSWQLLAASSSGLVLVFWEDPS